MIEIFKEVILANLYWLSLPLIGYACLRVCRDYIMNRHIAGAAKLALSQHAFSVFLFSFAMAVFGFALISLPAYLLHIHAGIITGLYWLLLVCSIVYIAVEIGKKLFSRENFSFFGLSRQPLLVKILFLVFIIILVADFFISCQVMAYAQGSADTYVHLSRVVGILSQGFTIESGFFGGLEESGYHYNVIYTLYVVGSQATHLLPFEMWQYSLGFFRLLQWLAIFTFASYILRHWLKAKEMALGGAILASILAISIFGGEFFRAIYPNQIVNIWILLLIMCLSAREYGVKRIGFISVCLALLITMTHPTYALMTALFIGLTFCILFVANKRKIIKQKIDFVFYAATIGVLMLGPIRTLLLPNRLNGEQIEIEAKPTIDFLGMSMKNPLDMAPVSWSEATLMILGVIGSGYLLAKLWQTKRQFAIALSLLLFFPLIAYLPPVFTILHAILPMWVIDRFVSMNVLMYVHVFLGICALIVLAGRILLSLRQKIAWPPDRLLQKKAGYIAVTVVVLLTAVWQAPGTYALLLDTKDGNEHYYNFMHTTYRDFHTVLKDEKLVVASQGDGYFLASLLPVDVLAIEAGHMSPVASADNRIACQAHLLRTFAYEDLKEVNASFVVLAKYDKSTFKAQKVITDTKPYLAFVAENENFYVYKVEDDNGKHTNSPYQSCVDFRTIEAS